jgi:hypothetical protein
MRATAILALAGLSLVGCRNDYQLRTAQRDDAVLTLEITSPSYGEFLGDEQIAVTGVVSPNYAILEIEGEPVEVAADGSFAVSLPVDGAYRIVDVDARLDVQEDGARIPVFSGLDPLLTWPGGITGRLLPSGMTKLGEALGATIDETGWSDSISSALPGYSGSVVSLTPLGVFHDPTVVELSPADDGMDALFSLRNITVEYQLTAPVVGFTETIVIGYERVAIGGTLVPELDTAGVIWLALTDAQIDLDEPIFEFGILNGWLFDIVIGGINEWVVEPLGEILLNVVLDNFGTFELGGPFDFDLDLLGTPMQVRLSDLFADLGGLGLELGVGLGEPASLDPLGMPVPDETTAGVPDAHVAIALHEGLFQLLMADALLPFLSQGLDLSGTYGDLIGAGITSLPGGDQAPAGDGWCLSLDPGTAYVARLQESTDPLAVVYLPDFIVDVGIKQAGVCDTWLKASLAMELGLGLDGTALDLGIDVAEGAVLEYGAEDVDEEAVVAGLGQYISGTLGLLAGGLIDLDLGAMLGSLDGGLLGDLDPQVVGSTQLIDAENPDLEGLYALSLLLWAE